MRNLRFNLSLNEKLRGNKKAVSPAISTVILTNAVVVLLIVTIVFANNFLIARVAANELSAMEQVMQSVGLQIDDVAWIQGSTRTVRYASKYGQVKFENATLTYSVYVNETFFANFTTGIIVFNIPISFHSFGNNYYKCIYPSNRSFLNSGPSAPVSYVYVVENWPMDDGSFIRVVAVPIIRMLNTTITTEGVSESYCKFYLPILSNGTSSGISQSITLTGANVSVRRAENVANVNITANFPRCNFGFDNVNFFNFASETITVTGLGGAFVEFYTGEVKVSL